MIDFEGVSRHWGRVRALDELNLHVEGGEFLVLVGESGCGKSTTLKLINRLDAPTSGLVRVAGRDVAHEDPVELRRNMGWVIQGIALFPHLNVRGNIGLVPRLLGWPREQIDARCDELLTLVGLDPEPYRDRLPAELSGGQRQRVGVARALAARPPILLMDEPFGALDPLTRASLQGDLRAIHDRLELTTVMVTHDMAEAVELADRIAVMKEGRLLQCDAPATLLRHPADPYVESLIATPLRQARHFAELAGQA